MLVDLSIDTLVALVASVTVEGIEAGIVVEVDREAVALDARGKLLVDAGTRSLVVRKAGFSPQSITRDFPPGERYSFRVVLTPLPAKVDVTAPGVRDATVLVDGRVAGLAPVSLTQARDARLARLRVAAGARDTISLDGSTVGGEALDATVLPETGRPAIGDRRVHDAVAALSLPEAIPSGAGSRGMGPRGSQSAAIHAGREQRPSRPSRPGFSQADRWHATCSSSST